MNFNTFLKQYDKNVCRQIVLNYLKLSSDLGNKFWFFLFCYENTNIKTLLEQILKHHPEGVLLLPESLISNYLHVNNIIEDIKQKYPKATFIEFSMIPQEYFDIIIKSTDLNFKFPSLWLNNITDKIKVLAYFVPVDDENAILSVRFYNRITGIRIIDRFIAWLGKYANKVIERQDKRVVETQNPKRSELRMDENLVTADRPIIEYRTKRNSLM